MLSQYRGRAMKKSGNLWDEQIWARNIVNFHFVGRKIPAQIQNTLFKKGLPKRGHANKVNFGQKNGANYLKDKNRLLFLSGLRNLNQEARVYQQAGNCTRI